MSGRLDLIDGNVHYGSKLRGSGGRGLPFALKEMEKQGCVPKRLNELKLVKTGKTYRPCT
jgi:hypothetical protein